jgi:predicted DNA binding CopG/RHH family protein
MKKRKKKREMDSDMPVGELTVIPDFLPPPSELAKAKTLITMNVDAETMEFFKREAKKKGGKYQRMMREVLKRYADYYGKGKKSA